MEEIPEWMRDNDLVLAQYRPQMGVRQALRSLFSLHNETYNVWSHVVGLVLFVGLLAQWLLAPLPPFANPEPQRKWPLALYLAACCYVYVCSAAAHLFYVVSKRVCVMLWKLDHISIAVCCTAGFVPIIDAAFTCSGPAVGPLYIGVTVAMAVAVVCVSMIDAFHQDRFRTLRAAVQLLFPAWAVVPMMHARRLLLPHAQASAGLELVGAAMVVMVAGALVYAARLTEVLFPGRFDIFGSSHNIMHTSVVVAHLLFFEGAKALWEWRGSADGVC